MLSDEVRYNLLRLLQANPEMSQRDVARQLGVSLGKVNYCLRSLVARGWIKAVNFKNIRKRMAYMYLLTPRGVEEKAKVSMHFLRRKIRAYEDLRAEIEQLRSEAGRLDDQ